MKTDDRVELTKNFIKKYSIQDEDLCQELYLIAIRAEDVVDDDALELWLTGGLVKYCGMLKKIKEYEIPTCMTTLTFFADRDCSFSREGIPGGNPSNDRTQKNQKEIDQDKMSAEELVLHMLKTLL